MGATRGHVITGSEGAACRAGVRAGDVLVSLNGQRVVDLIDYQYLSAEEEVEICVERGGKLLCVTASKDEAEPLGLAFETTLMSPMQRCVNKCTFCFVDQLPEHVRETLRVKDDDWRHSFIMGNYVTLTNISGEELARIAARGAGPLYISVHTTDGELRVQMLKNPRAREIMEQLRTLADAGIWMHTQLVLCPGVNDGAALDKSLADLYGLWPAVRGVALVPVGLTGHREGLTSLRPYDRQEAARVLDACEAFQKKALEQIGTRFAFAADEFYLLAGRALPPATAYEEFAQIENGVGLLALFECELDEALEELDELPASALPARGSFTIATGVSAEGFMREMARRISERTGARIAVVPVRSEFFGGGVTVTGLLTGSDLVAGLAGKIEGDVLLPRCVLKEFDTVLLDGMTVQELAEALGACVRVVDVDGAALVKEIIGSE